MTTRLKLQETLVALFGSNNVYYNPPEGFKMSYPAIRYKRSRIYTNKANNGTYRMKNCYEITVISKRPDDPVIEKILTLPLCTYNQSYLSEGFHHDVLTLYF